MPRTPRVTRPNPAPDPPPAGPVTATAGHPAAVAAARALARPGQHLLAHPDGTVSVVNTSVRYLHVAPDPPVS
jgi:hypothetical protein